MAHRSNPKPLLSEPDEIALLKDIAEALNEAHDIASAMSAILPRLSQVLGLMTAWAFRFDPQRSSFVEVGASGLPPALAQENASALKSSWCECQDRLMTGRLDTAINIVRCSRLRDAQGDKQGLEFHASIPLKMKGEPLGILNVAATGAQAFTAPALDLLRAIGYHVAVTLDRSALLADIRRHNEHLRALGDIARELTSVIKVESILPLAIERLAKRMNYEGVAIFDADRPLYVIQNNNAPDEAEYSYQDRSQALMHPDDRKILSDACSAMTSLIPGTSYQVRVESPRARAFSAMDEDILSAFSWHLKGLLDQATLHRQAVASAMWGERRKLAADLHDSVSQRLFSAQLLARTARQRLSANPVNLQEVDRLNRRVEELVGQSQAEMRSLIEAFRPVANSLRDAVHQRLLPLKESLSDNLTWTIAPNTDEGLGFETHEALIKILDEALHNVLKHAPGTSVHVSIEADANTVALRIQDQGPGFQPDRIQPGYGLSSMQERALKAGGTFRIQSHINQGTLIEAILPKKGLADD